MAADPAALRARRPGGAASHDLPPQPALPVHLVLPDAGTGAARRGVPAQPSRPSLLRPASARSPHETEPVRARETDGAATRLLPLSLRNLEGAAGKRELLAARAGPATLALLRLLLSTRLLTSRQPRSRARAPLDRGALDPYDRAGVANLPRPGRPTR